MARKSAAASAPVTAVKHHEPKKRVPVHEAPVPPSVEKAVQGMDVEHLQCRDFGHSWRPFSVQWVNRLNLYEYQLKCMRCTTIRTRWHDRTGAVVSSNYDYVEGYQIHGLGRLSGTDRDVIRLASIMAVMENLNVGTA
jgi:hypothetical protein